jgi:hypothetical protein
MSDENPHDSRTKRPDLSPCAHAVPVLPGTTASLDLDMLRAVFPAWRIGGSPGYWFAARGGIDAPGGPRSLLRPYLNAGTLLELAELLCLQEFLDALNDQELEAVW